jgi:hypothetical protein
MVKYVIKTVGILIGIEVLLFLGMMITSMTDQKPPGISKNFYLILKYVFGFPLVLINKDYPFFLENKNMPTLAIVLIIVNNLLFAFLIYWIFKRLLK